MKFKINALLLTIVTLCSLAIGVQAAPFVWNGTNNTWTSANWNAGVGGPTGGTNVDTATINGGTVTFSGHDTFGNAATTASPVITINSGGTLASGTSFNTIWNLTLNGGTLLASGGANATFPAFQLAGTVTAGGSAVSTINATTAGNSFNQINIGGTGNTTLTLNVANATGDANPDLIINATLQNNTTGPGILAKSGAGTLSLTVANSYTGGTAINAGSLSIGNAAALGTTGAISFGGGTLQYNGITTDLSSRFSTAASQAYSVDTNGQNVTWASGLNSSGGTLTKTGAGTLTLTSGNSYSGATSVNGGTLAFAGSGALAAAASITVGSGATLRFDRNDTFGNHVTAVSQTITVNGGTITNGNFFTTLGAVTLNGGTINSTGGVNASFPSFSLRGPITVGGSSASTISGTGGSSQMVVGQNSAGSQTTFDVANVTGDSAADLTVSVPLQSNLSAGFGAIATGIIKTGAGTMSLSGANTYTGTTTVSGGTLAVVAGGLISDSSAVKVTGVGATYDMSGITPASDTVGSIASVAGSFILLGGKQLIAGGDGTDTTLAGSISGTLGALTKVGAGTLTVTGATSYTGATTVNGGTLVINGGSNNSLGGTTNVAIGAAGTLDLGGFSQTTTGTFSMAGGATLRNGTFITNNADVASDSKYTGSLTLATGGAFQSNQRLLLGLGGTATLTISAASTGSMTFGGDNNALMNYVGVGGGSATLTVNGGTLNFTNATGGNGWVNIGSNSNTSNGSLVVNGGNVNVGTVLKLGGNYNTDAGTNATSALSIANGTVTVGGGNVGTNNGVLFMNGGNGNAVANTGNATLTLGTAGVLNVKQIQAGEAGTKTINFDGGTIRAGADSTTFLQAATGLTVKVQNGGATFDTNGNNITVAAALVADGSGGLTKSGAGTLRLSGANTYTGATLVNTGTLQVTANNALGTAAGGTTVANTATLELNNVNYSTAEPLSLNGSGTSGSGALKNTGTSTYAGTITAATNATINAGGGTLTTTGGLVKNGTILTIAGGGSVIVNGTGISGSAPNSDLVVDATTLVVNAASNYNGPTTVQNAGTLVANAAVTTTKMTVTANSTLSGTSSITTAGGIDYVYLNGTLQVGNSSSASALEFKSSGPTGSTVLATGSSSSLYFDLLQRGGDLTGNAAAADTIRLFGTLDASLGGTLFLTDSISGAHTFAAGDQWKIFDLSSGGSITGSLSVNYSALGLDPSLLGNFNSSTGTFSITSAIPEPSRAILFMLGLTSLLTRRRRKVA
jgi:autotransporter-associated beta strand protein